MRTIHRLIGYSQESFTALLATGAYIELIAKFMFQQDPMGSLSKNSLFILLVIPIPIIRISVSIFYTPERYAEYIKPTWGGRGIAIPHPDKYFFSTISESISVKRRIAGYVYAMSKIIFFVSVGAQFCAVIMRIFHE